MTAATTKGATAEGPSIAKMTGNINEGNMKDFLFFHKSLEMYLREFNFESHVL